MSLHNEKMEDNNQNIENIQETSNMFQDKIKDNTQENKSDNTQENKSDNTQNNYIKQIQELNKKIEYYDDQLKRSQADFINFKKRSIQDKENFAFYEVSKILNEFLIFKQTLEKAVVSEENQKSKEHLIHLKNNYENILNRLKVKKENILGKDFDYNIAECVQTLKVKNKKQHNKVLDVLENAYTYKDKLIKPAKVIVGELEE
jgi:molecular chaperone GrpE